MSVKKEKAVDVKPIIMTDVDGVLLRWSEYLPEFLEDVVQRSHGYLQFLMTKEEIVHVSENEIFVPFPKMISCTHEAGIKMVAEYNSTYGEMLPAYTDTFRHITRLSKEYDIIAVTCFGTDDIVTHKRWNNLRYAYGNSLLSLYSVGIEDSKEQAFRQLKARYGKRVIAFVDDRPSHVETCVKVFPDILPIHMNRNGQVENRFITANSWDDIVL